MNDETPSVDRTHSLECIQRLRKGRYRSAVVIATVSDLSIDNLTEYALINRLATCDYAQHVLDNSNHTGIVSIDADIEFQRLDSLAENSPQGTCLMVLNFDLILARMPITERERLWARLLRHFPYRNASLVIVMPLRGANILPSTSELSAWNEEYKSFQLW